MCVCNTCLESTAKIVIKVSEKKNYRHEDRARTRECEYGGGARVNDSVAALSNVHGCPEKHLRREMMR